tara:strand:- start:834 stop:1145 length:312 start_codon:yes stop_codon:yes gene_type:complete
MHKRVLSTMLKPLRWVNQPKWEPDDERALRAFYSTKSGKKLKAWLLNAALQHNATATECGGELAWKAGYANGFRGAIASLDALMVPPESSTTDAEEEFDWLRP